MMFVMTKKIYFLLKFNQHFIIYNSILVTGLLR